MSRVDGNRRRGLPAAPSAPPPGPGTRDNVVRLPLTGSRVLHDFQSDALIIEESAPPRITRLTLYAVAALIISAVTWAALSEVDRVVVAPGRLVSTTPNIVVQPLETAVVRRIDAAVGDIVRAGSTLAALDSTFPDADVTQLRVRLANRTAHVARLQAEIEGGTYAPSAMSSEDERLQVLTFQQRQSFRQARLRDFDERVARTEASMATNRVEQQALEPRLEVMREIEAMRVQLFSGQVGSRVQLLEARNARLDLEGRIGRMRQGLVELEHELRRTRAERESFVEEYRQSVLEELVRLRTERDSIAEELGKAERRRQLVVLTAPVDAIVLEVASRSIGSVVREAETLFVLVPLAAPLEVELSIEARDIGRMAVQLPVRIKLDAFPYQEHGTASGLVRMISEGAFAREQDNFNRDAVFRARVQLTSVELNRVPPSFRLIPGMTVTGEVEVGRRNILFYFLSPLLRGLDESLREP